MKWNCEVCGKEIPETNKFSINYNNKHMIICGKHYAQYIKFGKFLDNSPKTIQDPNDYEIYSLKNCEDLVQYFNLNFFNRVKLTFYEYNLNLTKANGFGWIFSPSGIRQKLEENKFLD